MSDSKVSGASEDSSSSSQDFVIHNTKPKMKSVVSALFDIKPDPVEEAYLIASDNMKILYKLFRPTSTRQPKCSIVLIHGFGEHHGRFLHVVQSFLENNCIVHAIDLRGHGLSGGPRADGKFEHFMMDINMLHSKVDPSIPCFFFGHSMGGLLVLTYGLSFPAMFRSRIDGVIATSPWLRLVEKIQPPWYKKMALKMAGNILDDFLITSNVDPCSLSGRDKVASEAIFDRLIIPFLTIRFVRQLLDRSAYTLKHADKFKLPLLLIHGARDRLTSPEASMDFVRRCGSKDKTARIFHDSFHEVHNDTNAIDFLRECNHWIDARIQEKKVAEDFDENEEGIEVSGMVQDAAKVRLLLTEYENRRRLRWRRFVVSYLILAFVAYHKFKTSPLRSILWPLYLLSKVFA